MKQTNKQKQIDAVIDTVNKLFARGVNFEKI